MKNIITSAIVSAVVLGLGIFGYSMVQQPKTDTTQPGIQVGSVSGSDFPGPNVSVGGLYTYSYKMPMTSSASTTCQFRSPLEGTSTLRVLTVNVASSSSSASIWEVGKSSGAMATTTLFGTLFNIAASGQGAFNASSTVGAAGDANVLAPGTWVAVKTAPFTTIRGTCTAEFKLM